MSERVVRENALTTVPWWADICAVCSVENDCVKCGLVRAQLPGFLVRQAD